MAEPAKEPKTMTWEELKQSFRDSSKTRNKKVRQRALWMLNMMEKIEVLEVQK